MLRSISKGGVSKYVQIFEENYFLAGLVESSREGGFWCLGRVGRPGTLTISRFPHPEFPHGVSGNVLCLGLTHPFMV